MNKNIQIFCDFDGTITARDTTDVLLESLADPMWEKVEKQWERGEINSQECMARQIPLIRGGWPAVLKVLETVAVDKSFATFVNWCRLRKIPVYIVSDGIDRVIQHILSREGITVDRIWSNQLVEGVDGSLSLKFPSRGTRIVCPSGQCKCQVLDAAGSTVTKVVIGDGRSDFCWSRNADILFAKDKLLSHARGQNLPCRAYESFVQIRMSLDEMMAAQESVAPAAFAEAPLWVQI